MSRKTIKISLLLAGALLLVAGVALAEKAKSINIPTDSVLPSGQELKAGRYQVDVNETSQQVTFKQGDKVVATSGCKIVEKPEKEHLQPGALRREKQQTTTARIAFRR